jgi:hypothetical protein
MHTDILEILEDLESDKVRELFEAKKGVFDIKKSLEDNPMEFMKDKEATFYKIMMSSTNCTQLAHFFRLAAKKLDDKRYFEVAEHLERIADRLEQLMKDPKDVSPEMREKLRRYHAKRTPVGKLLGPEDFAPAR